MALSGIAEARAKPASSGVRAKCVQYIAMTGERAAIESGHREREPVAFPASRARARNESGQRAKRERRERHPLSLRRPGCAEIEPFLPGRTPI